MTFDMNPAADDPHAECARAIRELREHVECLRNAANYWWCEWHRAKGRPIPTPTSSDPEADAAIRAMNARSGEILNALERSVKSQSCYSKLLSSYDGGSRRSFSSAEEWMEFLAELERPDGNP